MKLFKSLFKLLLVIVILAGVAVGIVLYQLSDNTFNEPEYLKELEPIEFDLDSILSKGIKDCDENSEISLTLEEKEVNSILKALRLDLNEQLASSNIEIETMHIVVEDSYDITFVSYLDFYGFKTSLKGDFVLDLVDNIFKIQIDNLKIGKMNFNKSNVVSLIKKFISNDNLKNELEVAGIKLNSDLNSMSISLNLMDVKDKILSSIEGTNEYDLYQTLIGVIFRVENLITLSDLNGNIGIDIDLTSFSYDSEKDANIPYYIDFNSVNSKVETLLNNNLIDKSLCNSIATFLTKGYYLSDDKVLEDIQSIDLSIIGIENKTTYTGIIDYEEKSIDEVFASQIPTIELLSSFEGFKLNEDAWNNFFIQSEAVGKVFTFIRKENNEYKSSYVAIESLYIDIKNDHFALYLTVSINGKSLVINFELDSEEVEGLRIGSTIQSMRIGSDLLNDEEIKKLLSFLDSTINDEWIIIESNDKAIDFDFTSMFTDNVSLKNFINNHANIKTSFEEKDNEGYTLIDFEFVI